MVRSWLWALSSIAWLPVASCSSVGAGDAGGRAPPDGVRITASEDGVVQVFVDGRGLFATAPVGPIARNFTETFSGIPEEFRRGDEAADPFSVESVSNDDSGATVTYVNASRVRRATLTAVPLSRDISEFRLELAGTAADSIAVGVRCDDLGTFHGFGEQYNATDQRGERFPLLVREQGQGRSGGGFAGNEHTTYFPMPYYMDARGFGVLFDTARRVDVDLCSTDENVAWVEVVSGAPVTWRVLHGPTPVDVIRQLGEFTGRPAMPPLWAYYLWIGSQGGRGVVLAEVDALEQESIPVSVVWVQDWGGVRRNIVDEGFGVRYVWEPRQACLPDELCPPNDDCSVCYPDFAGMVGQLHDRGYRFLTYVNPFIVNDGSERFATMEERGMLVRDVSGETYIPLTSPNLPDRNAHPDFSNPATLEFIADSLANIVRDYGVDGWMADFGEWIPLDAVARDGSDPIERRNTFPIDWLRATRLAMDAVRPDGDWVMFARSGFTGVQGVAQIHWTGDQETNWGTLDGLPTVIPAMINLGLAGQPFVTHDIAGFARGAQGPSDRELYQRWTELGAFTPIMRTHQGAAKLDNWRWDRDATTTAHFRRFAYVHCALVDDFVALAADWETTGAPIVRHMMLNFPNDRATWDLSDQYMLGDSLLVAPILSQGATSRSVYFPQGEWFNVWTGDSVEGPARIDVEGAIGSPPVFSLGRDRDDLRNAEANLSVEDCR